MKYLSERLPANMRGWLVPALCVLLASGAAAVFLFGVPVSKLLLMLLLLACPLSHLLLGHGGHGHSADAPRHSATAAPSASEGNRLRVS